MFKNLKIVVKNVKCIFKKSVLRSRNYLFSAPAPALTLISAPAPAQAPATAMYCHLKLLYNVSTIPIEV